MRASALAFLLLLAGCAPRWQVGQCVRLDMEYERWQTPVVMQIVEVGHRAYRVRYWAEIGWTLLDTRERSVLDHRSYYHAVPCPG